MVLISYFGFNWKSMHTIEASWSVLINIIAKTCLHNSNIQVGAWLEWIFNAKMAEKVQLS